MKSRILFSICLLIRVLAYAQSIDSLPLNLIKLPRGYHIEVYAYPVENARQMAFADDTTLFVGSREKGNVYAITKEREVIILTDSLEMPSGVDFYKGALYVSEVSRILKYENILDTYKTNPKPWVINNTLPAERWHGWKFIKVGPDEKLYVPIGAPCNKCDSANPVFASICRMNLDGSNMDIYARGIRNTVGFDWDTASGALWFTDNGCDLMGDDIPPDELNKANSHSLHFGFPYFHGTNIQDPEFWSRRPKNTTLILAKLALPAHVAPLGMRFYYATMFPEKYRNGIFIAEHGSWNRSVKVGYRITYVTVKKGAPVGYETFAEGWLQGETYWGRPADVEIGPDGALYVADDYADCIYRIYYKP